MIMMEQERSWHLSNHCNKISKSTVTALPLVSVTGLLTLSGRKEGGESADDDLGFHASFLPVLKLLDLGSSTRVLGMWKFC